MPGAEIGEYPGQPGAQSTLKVACTFTTAVSSGTYTIHDFQNVGYHQGEARKVTLAATFLAASTTVQVNGINGLGGMANHGISGTGIAPGAFIKTVALNSPAAGKTTFTLNIANSAASGAIGSVLLIDNGNARVVKDGQFIAPFTDFHSATANFVAGDSTHSISATGLAENSTMTFVNASTVTLSAAPAAATTVAAGSNGLNITALGGVLHLATNTVVPGAGRINIKTSATTNGATAAVLAYTGKSGTTDLTGVTVVSGSGTLATGNAVNVNGQASLRANDITTSQRSVTDSADTCTATSITSAAAHFTADDIGMDITGTGIAAGAVITAVSGNTATVAGGAVTTAPCPGHTAATFFTVGTPSVTAPKDGDSVLNQGAELDLNPNLVPGSNPCSLNKPEGFSIIGQWVNPGSASFANGGFSAPPAGAFQTVGQIQFKTSVITYSAYVIQKPAGVASAAEPQTAAHFDINFPNIPTSLAICPNSPAGVGLAQAIQGSTTSQAAIPSGTGRPSTAQFRATQPLASGTLNTTAYMVSTVVGKSFNIPGTCLMNATPTVDFHCGNG